MNKQGVIDMDELKQWKLAKYAVGMVGKLATMLLLATPEFPGRLEALAKVADALCELTALIEAEEARAVRELTDAA
jgi:hypothetical protein